MPYPSEHAARVVSPGEFEDNSFRRIRIATGIEAIIGRKKGETRTTVQAYRFDKAKFTPDQAREWLKKHNVKTISFEKAAD